MTDHHTYFTYLLANRNHRLYVGMTNDLTRRLSEHLNVKRGFAASYRITKLVYFEVFPDPNQALKSESQIKRWRREKKIALIESVNPTWDELVVQEYGISRPMDSKKYNYDTKLK